MGNIFVRLGYSYAFKLLEVHSLAHIRLLSRYLVLLIGCALAATIVQAGLEVQNGYVRGLPPGLPVTAAFMHLVNGSDKAVEIVNVTTDSAERAEIHAHYHRDGMMRMEQVTSIIVPAHDEFVLAPGGYHLMLINLNGLLREGDLVSIKMISSDGEVITVQLPVRSVLNEPQGN